MSVKREDLQAAAAVGVVQYTQVDPLLIFLLQRDMNQHREAMLKEKKPARMSGVHVAFYMIALMFIGVATAMIALYTKLAVDALGAVGILWFIGLYALFTLAVAAWFERRKIGAAVRIFTTSVIALLPLAVFASQQLAL
jgi:NADH:ubiquinone oxidoreductase subunit 3 (subunit A)